MNQEVEGVSEATHTIRVGEVVATVTIDAPAPLTKVALEFEVHTEDELRALVERLGGIGRFIDPAHTKSLLPLYDVNDEDGVRADVLVWLRGDAFATPVEPPAPSAVLRLLEERAEAERARERVRIGRVREGEEFPGARERADAAGLPIAEPLDGGA